MKMITGFLTPSAGSAEICGINVATHPIHARRRLGYLPEGAPAYADLTARTYLRFIADVRRLYGASGRHAIDGAVDLTNLAHILDQPIETLSKGYKRRIGLAQALLHDPDVLVLDEPTDGLDPNQKHEVRSLIRAMSQDKAIIISTHILEEVETVCNRSLIIADGRIVAQGTPQEFERPIPILQCGFRSRLRPEERTPVRAELEALPHVAAVEARTGGSDREELVALPRDGRDILSGIAPMARQRGWPIEQLQLLRGHLDDVFRAVTTGDHDAGELPARAPSRNDATAARDSMPLRDVWTICRRELIGYFSTPIAYVFIVVFLAAMGAFTFFLGGFFTQGQATLESFFQFHPWLYLFLIPAITMRLWAEERKSGSIRTAAYAPGEHLERRAGEVHGRVDDCGTGPAAHGNDLAHRKLSRIAGQRSHRCWISRELLHGRRLSCDRCIRLRDDQEPSHRIHPHGRTVLSLHRKRTERGTRVLQRLGTACGTGHGRQLQFSRAFSAGFAGGRRHARCRVLHLHHRVLPVRQRRRGRTPEECLA